MGLRRVTKKFLWYLIPTLAVLFAAPVIVFLINGRKAKAEDPFPENFRCGILLGDFETLSKGYLTGLNYELLELFARSRHTGAEVFLADSSANWLDSLRLDSLSILVVPACEVPDKKEFPSFHPEESEVAWVVRSKSREGMLIKWMEIVPTDEYQNLLARFLSCYNPYRKEVKRTPGIISPYDDLLKEGAARIGWDWKLLAALVWSESRFRVQAKSPTGAMGLMQMIPRTARRYGVTDAIDPEENILAGCEYIGRLQGVFRDYAANEEELVKFTLAAYNGGEGRILKYIDSARVAGYDTSHWESVCRIFRTASDTSDYQATEQGLGADDVHAEDSLAAADTSTASLDTAYSRETGDTSAEGIIMSSNANRQARAYVRAVLDKYRYFKTLN